MSVGGPRKAGLFHEPPRVNAKSAMELRERQSQEEPIKKTQAEICEITRKRHLISPGLSEGSEARAEQKIYSFALHLFDCHGRLRDIILPVAVYLDHIVRPRFEGFPEAEFDITTIPEMFVSKRTDAQLLRHGKSVVRRTVVNEDDLVEQLLRNFLVSTRQKLCTIVGENYPHDFWSLLHINFGANQLLRKPLRISN